MATQRVIAAHIDLSVVRIQQLQYAGVIEKDASLNCARLAYIRWLRERSSSKSSPDINNERARLVHHQANLAALEEETRRSKLIPADEINSEWDEMTSIMRAYTNGCRYP
jgi:phage terminase Nu1 subunit (DNA packaging protein)